MGVAMRRQAQADTAMIITMMYEELISLTINSFGGASPANPSKNNAPVTHNTTTSADTYNMHAM